MIRHILVSLLMVCLIVYVDACGASWVFWTISRYALNSVVFYLTAVASSKVKLWIQSLTRQKKVQPQLEGSVSAAAGH